VSCLHVIVITAAGPEAPGWGNPVWSYGLPELLQAPVTGGSTTVGRLLGLGGPLSLVPLLALFALLGRELARALRSSEE
jgi:hypothetical protein